MRIVSRRLAHKRPALLQPAAILLAGFWPAFAAPSSLTFTRLEPASYAVFVANWVPDQAPLCAVITNADQWARVLHPAPTMWHHAPFAPPPDFWRDHSVLLTARVTPAAPVTEMFRSVAVTATRGATELDYTIQPPPAASYRIKAWLGISLPRKPTGRVVFRENGLPICTLYPARGLWLIPRAGSS